MRKTLHAGFTLVELLVVIGIIALLISILLPVLNRAKESANRVLCMNNTKQLLAGLNLYTTDNKGIVPLCNWGVNPPNQGTISRAPGWLFDDNASLSDPLVENDLKTGVIWKLLKNSKVFKCPFDTAEVRPGQRVRPITSYGFNGAVNAFGTSSPRVPFFKINQFAQTDIIIWELDEYWTGGANIYNDGANKPEEGISSRHGSRGERDLAKGAGFRESKAGAVVGTFGLSVEWITVKDYWNEADPAANAGKRTRLYCVPKSFSANGHANGT